MARSTSTADQGRLVLAFPFIDEDGTERHRVIDLARREGKANGRPYLTIVKANAFAKTYSLRSLDPADLPDVVKVGILKGKSLSTLAELVADSKEGAVFYKGSVVLGDVTYTSKVRVTPAPSGGSTFWAYAGCYFVSWSTGGGGKSVGVDQETDII